MPQSQKTRTERSEVPVWSIFWWAITAAIMLLSEAFVLKAPSIAVYVAAFSMISFAIGEGAGLITKAPGDTYSEWVRRFYGDKPFRRNLVRAYALYVILVAATLLLGVYTHWIAQTARITVLFIGAVSWLPDHWAHTSGEKG